MRHGREAFAKTESMNPGASTKDRPAQAMLDGAWVREHPGASPREVEAAMDRIAAALA